MERAADPRVYKCAAKQSMMPLDFITDPANFAHCLTVEQVLTAEVDKPIADPASCFARYNAQKDRRTDKE